MLRSQSLAAPVPASGARAVRARLAFTLLGLIAAAIAVESQPPPSSVFGETVEVRVVNLEVVVTDAEGMRVSGLQAKDFELKLDGEVIDIEFFSEVDEGVVQSGEGGPRSAAGLQAGEAVATSYLLFIDEFFSITRDRDRLIDRLIEQVEVMGPADRMAVVRYDGTSLDRVTGWTSGDQLRAALRTAKNRESLGLRRLMEQRPIFKPSEVDIFERSIAAGDVRLTLEEQYFVERLEEQLQRVVRAGASTLRSFAAPRGRRVMILLSGGWPHDPVEYVLDDLQRAVFASNRHRFDQLYDPLRDTANLLGYTLYPVDVPGFQATSVNAESASAGSDAPLAGQAFFREAGLHRSLEYLAKETGGKALINSARDRVLSEVVADTRKYYWLGFTAPRAGDDQRHDIEVTVKTPRLEVRSRGDYFDFSRQREVTLTVESALYFGAPPSQQPLGVTLGKAERAGLRTILLPLEIAVPLDQLTLLPGPEGVVGRVELRVAVLDAKGATTETPVVPLDLRLESQPQAGAVLNYSTKLKLRRTKQTLVVAISDVANGTILSTSVEVDP